MELFHYPLQPGRPFALLQADRPHFMRQFRKARIFDARPQQIKSSLSRQIGQAVIFGLQAIQLLKQLPRCRVSNGLRADLAGRDTHQGRLGQEHLQQLPLFRRRRARRRCGRAAADRAFALACPRPRAQLVQSCPYALLLECQALRDTRNHQLLLDGAGRAGHFGSQGNHTEHRIRGPAPAFNSRGSLRRHHLIQLEFQGIRRSGQDRAKRLCSLPHQQVARVESLRQRGDRQVHILAHEHFQRPIHARVAACVRIKYQQHARHADAAKVLHVPGVDGRAQGRHHLSYARLLRHEHIHVAFHHGDVSRPGGCQPCLIQSVEMLALGKERRLS